MTTITDFSNELHIRLYVADLLRNNIKDTDFTDQAERMVNFILKNSSLPPQPKATMSNQEFFSNFYSIMSGLSTMPNKTDKKVSELEIKYLKYRQKLVYDPKSPDRLGAVVGYSTDFNSIIALCIEGSPKGVCKGDNDFVDWPEDKTDNGFFYISIEEVEKQLGS